VIVAADGFVSLARLARDRFGMAICMRCAALFFWQVTINIGMVTSMRAVMGVTLPLIGYGGSSKITMLTMLGLVNERVGAPDRVLS
jgi:cell division protein FtsW (lipid II flippase)